MPLIRSKRFLFFLLFVFPFLSACDYSSHGKKAKGGKFYGGTFTYVAETVSPSIFPLKSIRPAVQRVVTMLFEPLVKIEAKNRVAPFLAKRFSISPDGKQIVLTIRKNVFFHADPCFNGESNEMTVEDVKFSLEFACSANPLNQMHNVLGDKIVGSEIFYKYSKKTFPKKGVQGIKIINDSTISISLNKPYVNFLSLLTHPNLGIHSKKAFEFYGQNIDKHPVGTGPFYLKDWSKAKVVFCRNSVYWRKDLFGNQLPFLSEVCVLNNKLVKNEMNLFTSGKTDLLMELPVDKLENAFGTLSDAQKGKNVLHRTLFQKGVKINFFSFNCKTAPFNDWRVRKAFQLAINRQQIVDEILNGDGDLSNNGFVPKSEFYNSKKVKNFSFNLEKARTLLAEAGFPNGKGFPKLALYVSNTQPTIVHKYCRHCVEQLNKQLGLQLTTKFTSIQKRNRLIKKGQVLFWKSGWTADYPDPEAYLGLFYSRYRNENNDMWNINSFQNSKFNALFEQMQIEKNKAKRLALQNACDQIIIDDVACVPLYTKDLFVLVNIRVRDISVSRSGIIDLSKTYLKAIQPN